MKEITGAIEKNIFMQNAFFNNDKATFLNTTIAKFPFTLHINNKLQI